MPGSTAKVHTFPNQNDRNGTSTVSSPEAEEQAAAYAELTVTTNFSFLRGASHPQELVKQARLLRIAGIGIADRNTVAGVVRAHVQAKGLNKQIRELNSEHGTNEPELKIAIGACLAFTDGTPDILAYPQNRQAWGRLTRLLTVGKSRTDKGECTLFIDDLLEYIEGLNLIVMPPRPIDEDQLETLLARLRTEASRRSVWLAASMLHRGDDKRRVAQLASIARNSLVPLIAVNDVLYHVPERRALQDVVTCIREHAIIEEAGRRLEVNAERHLKAPQEMARLFRDWPKAITQTVRFLNRCSFSLDELGKPEYPDEKREGFTTPQEALSAFVEQGVKWRYPDGIRSNVRKALDHELKVTAELDYAPYFLTVHDIVQFARSRGILCQGRGSAANSVICYCLGITEVDPHKIDLLFERFVSAERREPPDIDVDFEHGRREEVIQYIYDRYGRDHAGMTATVICYRGRSSIREVGKVFGLSDDTIGALAGTLWGWSMAGVREKEARRVGLDPSDSKLQRIMALAKDLMGFPRHLSQHVGGFAITRSRLDEVVPVENAVMDDRTVIEWDKDDLDALELLKVDVLGLGMLTCLRRGFDLLRIHYGHQTTLPSILQQKKDDNRAIYRMVARADTIGVFQIESRAQMSMLPRLRPKKFYDLVIEVAIVRPGPIQGNMVHPYLRRREKREPVVYPKKLKKILRKTLGVPLFQEQAMRIAMVGAGFSSEKANKLRRSMATFQNLGTIDEFKEEFIEGMIERDYEPKFASDCWNQIKGFGSYGFPESHAASFANLVYASAWIKCRYPDAFAAALLNSQPMGFYAPSQIVRDAQEHGVEVRPVDVNISDWDCALEQSDEIHGSQIYPHRQDLFCEDSCPTVPSPLVEEGGGGSRPVLRQFHPRHAEMQDDIRTTHALRLGLRQISGFSEDDAKIIESVRGKGFDSVRDLWLRTRLKPATLEKLAHADAFRSLGLSRRDALWAVKALRRSGDKDDLPLFAHAAMAELEPDAHLPSMPPGQQVIEDYRHLHLSLKAHPVSFLRADLDARGIIRHELLPQCTPSHRVTIAGIVLVRQRPGTGNAIFMTLEDETGIANTILWPRTFERFRPIVMGARLISVTGPLQNEKGVIHIVAEGFEDLTPLLMRLSEDARRIDTTLPVDEAKRPVQGSWRHPRKTLLPIDMARAEHPDTFRHPRTGDSFVRMTKSQPSAEQDAAILHTAKVLPKGRNFH